MEKMSIKTRITFDEFLEIEKKLEIKCGLIIEAERIPKSKKLLKLKINFGNGDDGNKIVVTNLGDKFEPEFFISQRTLFITNLEPVTMMGVVSEAMIMPGTNLANEFEFNIYSPGTKLL
jgi:methionyl-tRNA synthetase